MSQRELRASPAVSPPVPRRAVGLGRDDCRPDGNAAVDHGFCPVRRTAPDGRSNSRSSRPALAVTRWTEQGRSGVGGRRARCPGYTPGARMAASSRHALGRHGDIDSVAIAPSGVGFAIETKTRGTTSASSAGWSSRLGGSVVAGGGGLAAERFLFCAWFGRRAWSATSKVCWWSRSTGSSRCCGKSRTAWTLLNRRSYSDRRWYSATSVKVQVASRRASVSARLVGASSERPSSSAMARGSQLIASCVTSTRVGDSLSRRADWSNARAMSNTVGSHSSAS